MFSDRRVPANRAFARDNPLMRIISACRKSMFFNKSACPQSLSPNPFPRERGYITGATAPRPCRGLRPCDPIFINDRGFSTVWDNPLMRIICLRLLYHDFNSRSACLKRVAATEMMGITCFRHQTSGLFFFV